VDGPDRGGHRAHELRDHKLARGQIASSLNAFTSVRALSAAVAMSISPASDAGQVGLRGVVRLSARNPRELEAADQRLMNISERLGVTLTPLWGLQIAALAATLPIGGTA
jgi:Ser/Thr protein kinase RdoA (MazF antagonist)